MRFFADVLGILMYKMIGIPYQHDGQFHAFTLFGLIIPVFALFRLAKFNIDDRQEENFIGLPTPAMTFFFIGLVGIIYHYIHHMDGYSSEARFVRNWVMNKYVLISLAIVFSILMVAPLKMFSLKYKSFGWKGNEVRYIFLTISAILLATLFVWALPLIIVLYIILSLINNLTKKSEKDEIQS